MGKYLEVETKVETIYCYEIPASLSGSEWWLTGPIIIKIHFVDKMFDHCTFSFTGPYTREHWRVLAEIEQKISEIEEQMARPTGRIEDYYGM
jgi:hypothetical protein